MKKHRRQLCQWCSLAHNQGRLKGGGGGFRFFLKSEGKEVDRKRKKICAGRGGGGRGEGAIVNIFFGG